MDTKPAPFAAARRAYENGMSLERLRLRFHLSEGEWQDVAPEEFAEDPTPDGTAGGY